MEGRTRGSLSASHIPRNRARGRFWESKRLAVLFAGVELPPAAEGALLLLSQERKSNGRLNGKYIKIFSQISKAQSFDL